MVSGKFDRGQRLRGAIIHVGSDPVITKKPEGAWTHARLEQWVLVARLPAATLPFHGRDENPHCDGAP
jgi:hypothetical protein